MATIVCRQGLQSCLESQLVEPRALRLTLSSATPHFPQPLELASKSCSVNSNAKVAEECCNGKVSKISDSLRSKFTSSNPDSGGWSFLQALFNGPRFSKEVAGNENTYVHPLVKRSLSTLSEKSLELCTENLGSETGSDDILEDNIFSLSSSNSESGNPQTWKQHKSRQLLGAKKAIAGDFPPPLTTISGSESLRVRPHRKNGRLVIKAVKAPSTNSVFQAERSNSRLRLSLLKYSTSSIDYEEETTHKEDDNNNNKEEEEFENDSNYIAAEEELEKEEGGERADVDVGAEMGTTKFQRREGRGRCKEGENEKRRIVKLGAFLGDYIHSFILDLPV